MPIYDITGVPKNTREERSSFSEERIDPQPAFSCANPAKEKSSFVSSLLSRLFFAALLLLDCLWGVYAIILFTAGSLGCILSFGRIAWFVRLQNKGQLSIKRSFACALALVAALFSPAFGIMIACTYFLMYDKSGIEEIIPVSLQDQFRDFFKPNS